MRVVVWDARCDPAVFDKRDEKLSFAAILCLACLIDSAIGWPKLLFDRVGHPVTWIGGMIGWCDTRMNRGPDRGRFWAGVLTTCIVVALSGGVGLWLQSLLPSGLWGLVLGAVFAWPALALRSMYDHVDAVLRPLAADDLGQARDAVSMIVGRDPNSLDAQGVARSALESLAENTSDGIVAPVFWGCIAGLPGLFAYKAINTLDSMIGHRTKRHASFGKCAARLDDVVNLIPARLTGALFAAVSDKMVTALRVMQRDARQHRSPNAGWPESAVAGALNVRLSGPRVYGDRIAQEPWVNAKAPDPSAQELAQGLRLYLRAMVVLVALLGCLAVALAT